MSLDDIGKKSPNSPPWIIIGIGVAVCIAGAAVYYSGALGGLDDVPRGETMTFDVSWETHHIGDDYRQDYPEAAKPEGAHMKATFHLKQLPRSAQLTVEAADVDIVDCEVWLNNKQIGHLSTGTPWHVDSFTLGRGLLRERENLFMVRSKIWGKLQMEDLFVRDVKLEMQY